MDPLLYSAFFKCVIIFTWSFSNFCLLASEVQYFFCVVILIYTLFIHLSISVVYLCCVLIYVYVCIYANTQRSFHCFEGYFFLAPEVEVQCLTRLLANISTEAVLKKVIFNLACLIARFLQRILFVPPKYELFAGCYCCA